MNIIIRHQCYINNIMYSILMLLILMHSTQYYANKCIIFIIVIIIIIIIATNKKFQHDQNKQLANVFNLNNSIYLFSIIIIF